MLDGGWSLDIEYNYDIYLDSVSYQYSTESNFELLLSFPNMLNSTIILNDSLYPFLWFCLKSYTVI
jgi:hypothetical protein